MKTCIHLYSENQLEAVASARTSSAFSKNTSMSKLKLVYSCNVLKVIGGAGSACETPTKFC